MLDAFWKDDGVFWTDLPAWTSSDDTSPDVSSLGVFVPDPVVIAGTIVQPDSIPVGMSALDPDIVIVTTVIPDAVPMTAFVKDFGQFIESVVAVDCVTAGVAPLDVFSGNIVFEYADFVPANIIPRDPYVFSDVTLTPDVLTCSMTAVDDHLYGVLTVVEADPLAMSAVIPFYYFEITSLLALDYLSITGAVPDVSAIGDCLIEPEPLAIETDIGESPPVSNCIVAVDAIQMSAGTQEQSDTVFSSLFEHETLPLVISPQNFTQRSLFTFVQDADLSVLAALFDPLVSVGTFTAPDPLAVSLSDILEFLIIAFSNVSLNALPLGTAVEAFTLSRSEGFEQEAALPLGLEILSPLYVGQKYFEGVILETPVTRSIMLDTPISLVQDFEGIGA